MQASRRALISGFLGSAERFPDRPALQLGGEVLAYRELRDRAGSMAAALAVAAGGPAAAPIGVFGHRSVTAYAGVLAALLRGRGYVPFNPAFPVERTRSMVVRSECESIIVDVNGEAQLDEVLSGIAGNLLLLLPHAADVSGLATRWPRHRFLGARDLPDPVIHAPKFEPDAMAYLLFTSGSTGQPKGVVVAQRNVTHFVDVMVDRYAVSEADRFSQTFDLTFDLSAFDMFVAWERGACLCGPTQAQKLFPARYISDCGITIWFSVPSTAALMSRLHMLKPGKFPGLRLSLFCGEALPADTVEKWLAAAPGSIIENLYGPTELTIACTLYRWDPERSPAECVQGLVPIGEPYPGMRALVADEQLRSVPAGEPGELLMTGPQLSLGYLRDPERTMRAFVVPPGESETYYRTGDRVKRANAASPMVYLGRIDSQIKIQGYRVELGEIEAVLREEARVETAVALGWPLTPSGADGIVGFIGAGAIDAEAVRQRAARRLPSYMQPSEIRVIQDWPLNANGKIDRSALREMLGSGSAPER